MSQLVTVIIPTFNRAHCIESTVRSVLAQTYANREVIVVDDGSTDGTCDRLAVFGKDIRVLRQPNQGPSAARNAGVASGRGEFVAFLDSDDEWMPEKLERQIKLMSAPDIVLSATNWCCRGNANSPKGFDRLGMEHEWVCDHPAEFVSRPGGHGIMLSSWMVRRDVLLSLGGFNNSLYLAEDNDLLFRLSFVGRFALTPSVLLARETSVDGAKLSLPSDLAYQRRLARAMTLALANARVLAFNESKEAQRQFGRMYGYWLRKEMELAALDGRSWSARRLAREALVNFPDRTSALVAFVGSIFPAFVGWHMRRKYAA